MVNPNDALVDIFYVLTAEGIRMQRAARRGFQEIFNQSLGDFLEKGVHKRDVWNEPEFVDFQRFILDRVAKEIAAEARRESKDTGNPTRELDKPTIRTATITVMHREDIRNECRKVVEDLNRRLGEQVFLTPACGPMYWTVTV